MPTPSRIPRLGWVLAFAAAVVVLTLGWSQLGKFRRPASPAPPLPVLGTMPDFAFTDQNGRPIRRADLAGKICVVDFIFTRCAGPCPVMTSRLAEFQRALDGADDVRLVSVSVDPEYDQPPVLARYAARFGADPARWIFLTGTTADVEKFSTKGMLLALAKDGNGDPMHAQKFVVVDGEGRIRAYRDLNDPALVPTLFRDVENLRTETRP